MKLLPLLAALFASSAQAAFLSNYADWQKYETYGQVMYIQGLFDSRTIPFTDDAAGVAAARQGTIDCFVAQHLTAGMLADAVTKHYQTNLDDWSVPPSVVFLEITRRVCLTYINDVRAKAGLEPWQRSTGAINVGGQKP